MSWKNVTQTEADEICAKHVSKYPGETVTKFVLRLNGQDWAIAVENIYAGYDGRHERLARMVLARKYIELTSRRVAVITVQL